MANRWIRVEDNFVGVAYVCENCGYKDYVLRRKCLRCDTDTKYKVVHYHLWANEEEVKAESEG